MRLTEASDLEQLVAERLKLEAASIPRERLASATADAWHELRDDVRHRPALARYAAAGVAARALLLAAAAVAGGRGELPDPDAELRWARATLHLVAGRGPQPHGAPLGDAVAALCTAVLEHNQHGAPWAEVAACALDVAVRALHAARAMPYPDGGTAA
jgi:hypothetical protein